MFRSTGILLTVLLTASAAYAEEIYKSVDEKGVPSFSDTQTEGAEKITVEPVNVQTIPTPNTPPLISTPSPDPGYNYTTLEIISPENEATLRDEHNILLQVALKPELQRGDKIEFLGNGQPLQPAGQSSSMQLINFDRGTHTLSARIIDKKGKVLKTSNPVTVHIFRTVVKQPPAPKKGD